MNKYTFAVFLTAFLMSITLQAQDGFHRAYKSESPDSINIVTGVSSLPSGEFLVLSQDDSDTGYSANLMRLLVKGDSHYGRRVFLADSTRIKTTNDVVYLNSQIGVMTAILEDDEKSGAVVGFDINTGIPAWSMRFGTESERNIQLETINEDKFLMASTIGEFQPNYSLSMLDAQGTVLWSNTFDNDSSPNSTVSNIHYSDLDSTIYVLGRTGDLSEYFISKIDTLGAQLWSKSFSLNGIVEPTDLTVTKDSLIFVSAGLRNSLDSESEHLIVRHNFEGSVDWAKKSTALFTNHGIINLEDRLIIGLGRYAESDNPAIAEIDTAGNVINSFFYPKAELYRPWHYDHLVENGMGGVALFTTEILDQQYICPDLVSTNANLEIPCGSSFELIYQNRNVSEESIQFNVTDGITLDTMETDISNLNLTLPTISPKPDEWCPNVPIFDALNASPSNVSLDAIVTYEWSTGETDSLIIAMEEGEFMVTVTIDDEHCYKLCDTVTVSRLDLPQVQIFQNGDNCDINTVSLIASSSSDDISFLWNTGSTDNEIDLSEYGTYSVEVTDGCNEKASATINIEQEIFTFQIAADTTGTCEDFSVDLMPVTSAPLDKIEWLWTLPNGNKLDDMILSNVGVGMYTLSGTYCGTTFTQQITIKLPNSTNLSWPKVFFPNGEEELNRTFGPTNSCNLAISNYELKVFNRWGQEVFSSTNIEDEWDGNYNGGEGSTAVYVWYANYSIGDEPFSDKGDVTLIRQ